MSEHLPPPQDLLAEVAGIAATPDPITTRAQALLASLHRLLHDDAAGISLLDPERRRHPPLVRRGYNERIEQYLDSSALVDDMERIGAHRQRPPVRVKDSAVPPMELPLWADYLQPAGFGEGIVVPLITADGRYLGVLATSTETTKPASDAACALLARLTPLIAHAVDPLRTLTATTSLVSDAIAGVVLTAAGNTTAMPGLPGHRLLTPDSAVLTEAVACLDAGDTHAAFLAPHHRPSDPVGYVKTTVLACPILPPGHQRAVVLLSPPGDLHKLTHRELRILGMLITGWDHRRITTRLRLPRHALITTLDDIRIKLGAPTRDAAVIRAIDQGLHLPPNPNRTYR